MWPEAYPQNNGKKLRGSSQRHVKSQDNQLILREWLKTRLPPRLLQINENHSCPMKYTNTNQVKRQIGIYIDRNERAGKNSTLSGVFKYLRSLPELDSLGDYVLLSQLVSTNTFLSQDLRRKLFRVLSHSEEFAPLKRKDKTQLVEQLMEVSL